MRIEQLIYLIELSHSRSLNTAAKSLHISTQALSASMKTLENELGVTLLNRSNRGITFTENGQRLLQYAHDAVEGYNNLIHDLTPISKVQQEKNTLAGTLKLFSAPAFLESILPYKVQDFQQQFPNVKITITQYSTNQICTALKENNGPSLGLVLLPCNKERIFRDFFLPGNFTFRPINVTRFVGCVAKDSPLARNKSVSINRILKYPLVIYTTGIAENSPLLYQLRQYNNHPKIASVVSSINFWTKSIKNHLGIGFLNDIFLHPQSMVKNAFEDLVFINVKEPLLTVNGFLYTGTPSPIVNTFMNQFPAFHPTKNDPVFCKEIISL